MKTWHELYAMSPVPRRNHLLQEDEAVRAAWAVLDELGGRGGFDHWWDGIDEETQDEIFETLVGTISSSLDPEQ